MSDVLSVHCLHVGHSRTTYSYVYAACVCVCGHVSEHYSVFQSFFVLRAIVLLNYNFRSIRVIVNINECNIRCCSSKEIRPALCYYDPVTMSNDSCGCTKRILFHVEVAIC